MTLDSTWWRDFFLESYKNADCQEDLDYLAAQAPAAKKALTPEHYAEVKEAATKGIKSIGGKVEAFYYAFGSSDAYVIIDAPDNVSVAAIGLAINATGKVKCSTTVLLTPAEIDEAVKKQTGNYRAPGE